MQPPTVQAAEMLSVWKVFVPAGIFVWVVTSGLILYCCFKYRRKIPNQRQTFTPFHKNSKVEATFIVIPILMVSGLFIKTYFSEQAVEYIKPNPANVVNVVAYRWSWRFDYPGHDVHVNGSTSKMPTMVLPVGETTRINLTSTDVIHAFWVPAFMFKRDANPGYTETFDFNPTRTGFFDGRCAEYCGTYHANMGFYVRVVSKTDFARWLAAHRGRHTT